MTLEKSRRIVLAARPNGRPKLTDFRLEEEPTPSAGPGEILLRTNYLSLDPYMRGRMNEGKSYVPALAIGETMGGEGVATVIETNLPEYSVGDIVLAPTGWATHVTTSLKKLRKLDPKIAPVTTGLGVLGMPGFTAYSALKEIAKPKPGETFVVAAATGPVGSMAGQLAKLAGSRVIGIAGGKAKCDLLVDFFGFDAAVDHRVPDFREQLARACPDGIDVYFENVSGAVWYAVVPLLNKFSRVPVCGLIANYNGIDSSDGVDHLPDSMRAILSNSVTVRGFIYFDFLDEYFESFLSEVGQAFAEDKIRYQEDIIKGLENAPEALIGLLDGKNIGKLLVKVSE